MLLMGFKADVFTSSKRCSALTLQSPEWRSSLGRSGVGVCGVSSRAMIGAMPRGHDDRDARGRRRRCSCELGLR